MTDDEVMYKFSVGEHVVGDGRVFVIAEVGSNHSGDIKLAKEHIDAASESGADAVKFQSINIDKLYYSPSKETKELHAIIDMDELWCEELKEYAEKRNIIFFSSPTYIDAVHLLNRADISMFKLASAQVGTFPQLVREVAKTLKPTILSTGLVNYSQLTQAVQQFVEVNNENFAILHCNSMYPTPPDKVFLGRMDIYRNMFGCPVGFSDHTIGTAIVLAAVARGADIIEKHFLLDAKIETPDAPFSITPDVFKKMVMDIRSIEKACANKPRLDIEVEEKKFKSDISSRLILRRSKKIGENFDETDFVFLRSDKGVDVSFLELIIERMVAASDIESGEILGWDDLKGKK